MGIKNDPCNDTKALNNNKVPRAHSFGYSIRNNLAQCKALLLWIDF
jgi:hypothetical protein